MSDEPTVPSEPEPAETPVGEGPPEAEPTPGPTTGAAWSEVIVALGDLGDALATWAKAATDTPENRQHLDEVRTGVNDMASQAKEAFSRVAESDLGKQMAESATRVGTAVGETASEVGQAAAPHLANAFAGLADAFGRAAQKMGETASPSTPPDAEARPAPEPPRAEEADEPAVPEDDARE